MNDAKYIGLDVHQATISVAVRDWTGKLVMEAILETKAETILQCFRGLRGSLHVNFEEGTWTAWLYYLPAARHTSGRQRSAQKWTLPKTRSRLKGEVKQRRQAHHSIRHRARHKAPG